MEKVTYQGWQNCYRLTNGKIECVVTTDIGPRIIFFGLPHGRNEFANVGAELGRTGDDEWHIYGGHRFWHAPESHPRTYYPDNHPVAIEKHEGFVRLRQQTETTTGLQKEIDIALPENSAQLNVTHRLRNHNLWEVAVAPWALSVMAPGGTAVLPLPPRRPHSEANFLPDFHLTLWPYTDMQDRRWVWGEKYVLLQQEPGNTKSQKIGALVQDGWLAYANDGRLFVKTFSCQPDAVYPDKNTNAELFTCDFMLEVESLGPLINLAPQAEVEHVEHWHLFAGVPAPAGDRDVDQHILPLVQSILS